MKGETGLMLGASGSANLSVSVANLVASGQYSQLITSLQQLDGSLKTAVAPLLSVAVQMCHVCQHNEQMITAQRQALAQLEQQQQLQAQQLVTLLQMVEGANRNTTELSTSIHVRPRSVDTKEETAVFPPAIPQPSPTPDHSRPTLVVYMLGEFRLYQDDQPVLDWPSGKGKNILKYLLLHRHRPVAKEVLMDTFWPDSTADAARNNLNVAIYGLRKALRDGYGDFSHIVFQDNAYRLNPEMVIWLDMEAFMAQVAQGDRARQVEDWQTAVSAYHAAEALYHGEFLNEDRYETWASLEREHLNVQYIQLLQHLCQYHLAQQAYSQCIAAAQKLLAVDPCHEQAHRWLMACYGQQGQRNLALRQYHTCTASLQQELEVEPDPETTQLYEQIRNGQ